MNTPSRILISGSSGMIGTALVRSFTARQISIIRLVRKLRPESPQEIPWSPQSSPAIADSTHLENFDAVIHLSGANIAAHRWTSAYKKEIVESRVQTTKALATLLSGLKNPPRMLISASATGIYGDRGDEILTEASEPGAGFLAETCAAWEAATQPATAIGIRVAYLRFGVALSPESGALARMLPIFRLGLGGRLGSGRQWMNWISLPDLVSAVLHIFNTPQLAGAVNMVAPTPVTNAEFTQTLAHTLHRLAIFPAPSFALRAVVGEMADEALLASARVVPRHLTHAGFQFQHPTLAAALETLLRQ